MDGFGSKFQEMFLRVLSFASGKNFDHTQSVGHGQNVVGPTPLSKAGWSELKLSGNVP